MCADPETVWPERLGIGLAAPPTGRGNRKAPGILKSFPE
jgi:hypothetical protein